jgi:hypothetical protein
MRLSSLRLIAACTLLALASLGTIPQAQAAGAETAPLSHIHSHNDYEQDSPLYDALRNGIRSVEADIYYQPQNGGLFSASDSSPAELRISHVGFSEEGTLRSLYLDPLAREISEHHGSVFGDGRRFLLWIEFKQKTTGLEDILHQELSRYSNILGPGGPVQIILTGNEGPKLAYVQKYHDLDVVRDTKRFLDLWAPAPWVPNAGRSWYSFSWSATFHWSGKGPMPGIERAWLREIVKRAHAEGRRIRFYFVPQKSAVWDEALAAGVDLISADELRQISDYMKSVTPHTDATP